jgi:hypothetical protein
MQLLSLLFGNYTKHILCDCNYSEVVWNLVATRYNLPSYVVMQQSAGPANWFQKLLGSGVAKEKRRRIGIFITVWWMLWKERNKRIFYHKEASTLQLATSIQEAISLLQTAEIMPLP